MRDWQSSGIDGEDAEGPAGSRARRPLELRPLPPPRKGVQGGLRWERAPTLCLFWKSCLAEAKDVTRT